MVDRRLIQNFDWGLLCLTIFLGVIGIVTIYSAVSAGTGAHASNMHWKQLIWFGAGLVVLCISFLFNYKYIDRWAYLIYAACIVMLICVLFLGKYVGGSKRWLIVGPVSIQPSELAKLAVIFVLARFYSKHVNTRGFTLKSLIQPFVLVLIPFGLVVKQPDLGTAMIIVLIAASITVFVKIERRSFVYLVSSGLGAVVGAWFFLKEYQRQRILTFLDPDRDPLGAGYHIIQSKIAIGSGMITGKGYLKGTQNALSFLPEQHTDFIFSVLAEEWGFIGSFILLIAFLALIMISINVASRCREPFGTIVAVGITAMISWQVFINIGMVMGLMPVVGVTLPLVSYGGSSIISTMIGIGILMNISMRRFVVE
jgi:rod shape determining protein RodA